MKRKLFLCFIARLSIICMLLKKSERISFLIFYCVKLNMIIATLKGLMWVERFIQFASFSQKYLQTKKGRKKILLWSNFNIYLMFPIPYC